MVKSKKKTPSRQKYEQGHPVISIRVGHDAAETLRELTESTGKSLATLIKENLGIQKREEEKIQQRIQEAYNLAADNFEIWVFCAKCGERIYLSANSNAHKALIRYLKEHGWGHSSCPNPSEASRHHL